MKIVLVTQDAPLYLAPFLGDFLTRLARTEHRIAGAVVLPSHDGSAFAELRRRLHLYGSRDLARMVAAVARDRAAGRTVSRALAGRGIPRLAASDVNDAAFIELLATDAIDLVVSIASPQIFRAPLLNAPRYGCVNFHQALLPKYRGYQPLFWALLHGESEAGASVHVMDERLDNGPIIRQTSFAIDPADTLDDLYGKALSVGPALLIEAIEALARGDDHRIPNPASDATQFGPPTRLDVERLRAAGRRLL